MSTPHGKLEDVLEVPVEPRQLAVLGVHVVAVHGKRKYAFCTMAPPNWCAVVGVEAGGFRLRAYAEP